MLLQQYLSNVYNYIPIKEAQYDIIVTMPNMFEHH